MIIDLTKPLDKSFIPFSCGRYSDPPLEISHWCDITPEGFSVSRLSMGTQTGTHMDAPAHFAEGGATLEILPTDQLIGNYFLIDLPRLPQAEDLANRLAQYRREKILFLRTPENLSSHLSLDHLQRMLSLPPVLWILAGEIEMEHFPLFEFHRLTARAGKFLVEELDQQAARQVPANGEIFIAPLRLTGVSGSPCRVVVRCQ